MKLTGMAKNSGIVSYGYGNILSQSRISEKSFMGIKIVESDDGKVSYIELIIKDENGKLIKIDMSSLSPQEKAAIPTLLKLFDNGDGKLDVQEQNFLFYAAGDKLTTEPLIRIMLEQAVLYFDKNKEILEKVKKEIIAMNKDVEGGDLFLEQMLIYGISDEAMKKYLARTSFDSGFLMGLTVEAKDSLFRELISEILKAIKK